MSRVELVDEHFNRHDCIQCDRCGLQRTLELAQQKKWKLDGEEDLCDYCYMPPVLWLSRKRNPKRKKR